MHAHAPVCLCLLLLLPILGGVHAAMLKGSHRFGVPAPRASWERVYAAQAAQLGLDAVAHSNDATRTSAAPHHTYEWTVGNGTVPLCANGNLTVVNSTCVIQGTHILTPAQGQDTATLTSLGSIYMAPSSNILCPVTGCKIKLDIRYNLMLDFNSSIASAYVFVQADNVTLSVEARIDASGLGDNRVPLGKGKVQGAGGGYGGSGADCGISQNGGGDDYGFNYVMQPGHPGSPSYGDTLGGGVINMQVTHSLYLFGAISANGASAADPTDGGGSGGSVYVIANQVEGSGQVTATGGSGYSGGGGGRVAVKVLGAYTAGLPIVISGGQSQQCKTAGGSGSFYEHHGHRLEFDNGVNLESAITHIDTSYNFEVVAITDNSNVMVSGNAPLNPYDSMYVVSSTVGSGLKNLVIATPTFTCKGCVIDVESLSLFANKVVIDNQSNVQASGTMRINSTGDSPTVALSGTFQVDEQSIVRSSGSVSTTGLSLVTDSVYMEAMSIDINQGTQIVSKKTNCSLVEQMTPECFDLIGPDESFTKGMYAFFLAADVTVRPGSSITGSSAMICAGTLELSGTITTDSRGCVAAQGTGPGSQVTGGAGSGGGHGGTGGDSSYSGYVSPGGNAYDFLSRPGMSGSGGGSNLLGGVGGGVVFVRVSNTFTHNGLIDVNGGDGTGIAGQGGGGGGSAGSIFVQTSLLVGKGSFNANGGAGGDPGGGGGGGGIIHFDWNGQDTHKAALGYSGKLSATGGSGNGDASDGTAGKVTAVPCELGYEGVFCSPCAVGFYKDTRGNQECTQCSNAPSTSNYTKGAGMDATCAYDCDQGFVFPTCQTPYELLWQFLGEIPILVGALVVLLLVGTPAIVQLLRRNDATAWGMGASGSTRASKAGSINGVGVGRGVRSSSSLRTHSWVHEETSLLDRTSASLQSYTNDMASELNLNVHEIDHHICRVFFHGANTHTLPWSLSEKPPSMLEKDIDAEEWSEFALSCNEMLVWEGRDVFVFYVLWVLCYPLSLLWLAAVKERKARQLRRFVQHEYDFAFLHSLRARNLRSCLKITFDSRHTVAYLDILQFEGSHVEGHDVTMPMVLQCSGTGTFDYPFQLDWHDPLVAYLEKFIGTRTWRRFLKGLNARLRTVEASYMRVTTARVHKYVSAQNEAVFRDAGMRCDLAEFLQDSTDATRLGLIVSARPRPRMDSEGPVETTLASPIAHAILGSNSFVLDLPQAAGFKLEPSGLVARFPIHYTLVGQTGTSRRGGMGAATLIREFQRWLTGLLVSNRDPRLYPVPIVLLLAALLVGDFATTGESLFALWKLQERVGFVMSLCLLPLGILSPLWGIVAFVLQPTQAQAWRHYLAVNTISLVNAVVLINFSVTYEHRIWLFPVTLLVLKLIAGYLISVFVGHLEVPETDVLTTNMDDFWSPVLDDDGEVEDRFDDRSSVGSGGDKGREFGQLL